MNPKITTLRLLEGQDVCVTLKNIFDNNVEALYELYIKIPSQKGTLQYYCMQV